MISAILIDDEPDNIKLLALQLKLYCPEVNIVSSCTQSQQGLEQIRSLRPDLVFLDIEMPVMNGFELLAAIGKPFFQVVFVTAYDQFAVKAFRYSALDYLLKPIEVAELKAAVAKAAAASPPDTRQYDLLKQHLQGDKRELPDKIALPYQNGVAFTGLAQIVYCEADNNYTRFFLSDGREHLVAKTLKDIQQVLEERNFLRVHRQYLVNLDHIAKYVRGEGNYLLMSNQKSIPVARNQKEKLIERFGWL